MAVLYKHENKRNKIMSLDVSLTGETKDVECICNCCDHSHTRKETKQFFSANVTHNLTTMAVEAGIYNQLWRPEELEITKANQLIKPLREGLALMKSDPPRFTKLNPENGWGSYQNFVPWVERYIEACEIYPDADVGVWR